MSKAFGEPPTEAQRFQRKYAWDRALLGNAMRAIARIQRDYGLCFAQGEIEASLQKLELAYHQLKPNGKRTKR